MKNAEGTIWNNEKLIQTLKNGGVVVMPTDTIYGIVGLALNQDTVEIIYQVRRRSPEKSCIILISGIEDLSLFGINMTDVQREQVLSNQERPTSYILDCDNSDLEYLHRGLKTLAFRIPKNEGLRKLLFATGPIIAPSANPEGLTPAKNIDEAKSYFTDLVDLYLDGGEIVGEASRILKLEQNGEVIIIRV